MIGSVQGNSLEVLLNAVSYLQHQDFGTISSQNSSEVFSKLELYLKMLENDSKLLEAEVQCRTQNAVLHIREVCDALDYMCKNMIIMKGSTTPKDLECRSRKVFPCSQTIGPRPIFFPPIVRRRIAISELLNEDDAFETKERQPIRARKFKTKKMVGKKRHKTFHPMDGKPCPHCSTVSATPEWRSGPYGNNVRICNACGLFYRKLKQKFGLKKANLLMQYRRKNCPRDRNMPHSVEVSMVYKITKQEHEEFTD
ncbi:GATA-type transcription factor KNAG_0F03415 [Huiozyma naganishii CBS 8797]|uniref:GATA-type domain-containing protein n=1 Tax=Huiozyma naganishii (strain ATCC MYA-139 / BCRC 22969 / CBS 8797 / KCTC 17520 / NBRC 10181 / NCYC 3082 / Yp74L-3) TaxID=1071383 RepID=J7RN93_HUIN7|nr:hypothetical protein KNAG_0F03415 [Kazachstania naganishii CBS 8797]CCK71003.1 hypothetical protein KNAG_0F03415 [Kazachstania naganishii CBS 8797]